MQSPGPLNRGRSAEVPPGLNYNLMHPELLIDSLGMVVLQSLTFAPSLVGSIEIINSKLFGPINIFFVFSSYPKDHIEFTGLS